MNEPTARWLELYHAALIELDRDKLLEAIELAEEAIRERARARLTADELQQIQDALRILSLLRRDALR